MAWFPERQPTIFADKRTEAKDSLVLKRKNMVLEVKPEINQWQKPEVRTKDGDRPNSEPGYVYLCFVAVKPTKLARLRDVGSREILATVQVSGLPQWRIGDFNKPLIERTVALILYFPVDSQT